MDRKCPLHSTTNYLSSDATGMTNSTEPLNLNFQYNNHDLNQKSLAPSSLSKLNSLAVGRLISQCRTKYTLVFTKRPIHRERRHKLSNSRLTESATINLATSRRKKERKKKKREKEKKVRRKERRRDSPEKWCPDEEDDSQVIPVARPYVKRTDVALTVPPSLSPRSRQIPLLCFGPTRLPLRLSPTSCVANILRRG